MWPGNFLNTLFKIKHEIWTLNWVSQTTQKKENVSITVRTLILVSTTFHSLILDLVNTIAITSDNKYGISGSRDCSIKIWDLRSGKCLHTFYDAHEGKIADFSSWILGPIMSIAITKDNRFAISGSKDGCLKIWDLHHKICLLAIDDAHDGIQSIVNIER